jgi:hypothetical protein
VPGLLVLLSLVPHGYLAWVGLRDAGPSRFLLGMMLWNVTPVLVGLALLRTRFRSLGIGWLVATLAGSCWAVWVGLLRPTGSTSSLIFLFMPMWNLALVGPVGLLLASLWQRSRADATAR